MLTSKSTNPISIIGKLRAAVKSGFTVKDSKNAARDVASPTVDIRVEEFTALAQFMAFGRKHPEFFGIEKIRPVAQRIAQNGIYCTAYNEHAPPDHITIHDENYRETMYYKGLNSRQRAAHHVLDLATAGLPAHDLKLYAPEAVTAYANFLRARHNKFIGSEYTTDPAVRDSLFPILVEDLHKLSYPDASFHATIINEVFEHVPFLDKALSELARILKPGGKMVSSFPFFAVSEHSLVRARMEDGQVKHLLEPEYHGNPVDPAGSMVFEIPGWDVLERTRAAGFRTATMLWVYSETCGMITADYGGHFVLLAER